MTKVLMILTPKVLSAGGRVADHWVRREKEWMVSVVL
jgi:hypothetical protein